MRRALQLGGVALVALVAGPAIGAAQVALCRLNPPRSEVCPTALPALAGVDCTCTADGIAWPGRVVINNLSSDDIISGLVPPGSRRPSTRGMRPATTSLPDVATVPSTIAPTPARPEAPAPPGAVAQPALPDSSSRPLQPARALRLGSEIPDAGVGAYGVVALAATATPDTQARLGGFCRAFLASLPPQSSLPATVQLADEMLTYWPVTAVSDEQCDPMLATYDLFAGQKAIRDAAAHHTDMSGRGPFLIGWSPSTSRDVPDAIVLVLDLSNLESERSFTDALQFWQERVVADPSLWRNGFSMFLVRRAARDFADHYGSDILKALHLAASDEKK